MSLDFQKEEGRRDYLSAKLDDLLVGINDTYGKALMDELVDRLQNTIKDFNDEVSQLMLQLKENLELKQQMLQDIKTGKSGPDQSSLAEPTEDDSSKSKWEKKLEALG
ncbi:MAG: hypothetical protein ABIA75_04020 [Candidatus Neomarinimicrobiota bacterium]